SQARPPRTVSRLFGGRDQPEGECVRWASAACSSTARAIRTESAHVKGRIRREDVLDKGSNKGAISAPTLCMGRLRLPAWRDSSSPRRDTSPPAGVAQW